VVSSVGEGTTVAVRIPAERAPAASEPRGATGTTARHADEATQWGTPVPAPAPAPPGADRLLIAEDNADMRRYLVDMLERTYTIIQASDGQDALAKARSLRPDLVLADIMMPGIDGLELLRALRAVPATSAIPVILLSARAGQQSAIDGLAAGADDYLAKPFSSADLLARIRSNLDLARARSHESAWRTALVNAMQDGFFIATRDARIIEVNDAFTTLLGYGASDLPIAAPHPWWPRQEADPEGFALVSAGLATVLESGRGRFTLPLTHRDGHRLWADVAIDAVRDRDERSRLLVGTIRDITVEHLAAERDAALVRLSRKLTGITDSARVLQVALAELRDLWQADGCSLVTWNRSGRAARSTASPGSGDSAPELPVDAQAYALADVRRLDPGAAADRLAKVLIDDAHDDDVAFLLFRNPAVLPG
jgi:PAS domain S-box-containing protein